MYLTGLTAWLRDLASRWNLETPPYKKELQEIGLLQLIEGGTTKTYYNG
jgi:hypothetical protein